MLSVTECSRGRYRFLLAVLGCVLGCEMARADGFIRCQISVDGFTVLQSTEVKRSASLEEVWFKWDRAAHLAPTVLFGGPRKEDDLFVLKGKIEMKAEFRPVGGTAETQGTITVDELTIARVKGGKWMLPKSEVERTLKLVRELNKKQ